MQRNCCYECEKYEKYYLKRKADFASAGAGFCVEQHKSVSSTDVCEHFKKVPPQEIANEAIKTLKEKNCL